METDGLDTDACADAPLDRQVGALAEVVQTDRSLAALLDLVASRGLPGAYVGGGAVAAAVWNRRFGFPPVTGVKDYDVIYHDPSDLTAEAEQAVEDTLADAIRAGVAIDVTNEARVHLWYETRFGRPIEPYRSSEAAIATWPSTTVSIGVRRGASGLDVCAPYGLRDLFLGVVRPNPTLVSREIYEAKAARWLTVWPQLVVYPWSEPS